MFENDTVLGLTGLSCPVPASTTDVIRLGHGSGGKLSAELLADVFLPELGNVVLSRLDDAACVDAACGKLALTTDSYVVNPIFFPGGDIGRLAVHGTINDLAMRGARPIYLTAAFILEEGLSIDDLRRVVRSMRLACEAAGVLLVAGDTKVVNKGAADKLFITTS
ncbi:MAG TPA: AIR synthase related protein, partial [Candidatus Obscuribacterales bacterium]